MAVWQFSLHALPADAVKAVYGDVRPLSLGEANFEACSNWQHANQKEIEAAVSGLLTERSSWSQDLRTWGNEDGNRIDLFYEADSLESIFVRVDVRTISYTFLNAFIDIARRHNWVLLTEDRHLIDASVTKVLSAIQRSRAAKFVADPEVFLANLNRYRREEQDRTPD